MVTRMKRRGSSEWRYWLYVTSGFYIIYPSECHTEGGGRTGIPPPSMSSPPPQNLKVDLFLILSSSLVANFQPFWSPRSHQKQHVNF